MLSQEAELDRVNRFYDSELARLKQLWAGALPGSMGPLAVNGGASPAGKSASNQKSSTLN
jgi:hypothetical protein